MSEVGVVAGDSLEAGSAVEVRDRFEQRWVRGFELIDASEDGYRVRRLSDGAELPVLFTAEDIRPERPRRQGQWWH